MLGSVPANDDQLRALVAPLRARPAETLLAFDYDGTLAAVVDDPAAAVPVAGAIELLDVLAGSYAAVAVLSGRPVAFLVANVAGPFALSGLYGLEQAVDGAVVDHPDAPRWRPVVAAAADAAARAAAPGAPLHGIVVEPKGLSLTLHSRTHPELAAPVEAFALELGERLGLEVRPAKRSVELHPPIAADKGTALGALVASTGARQVLFIGDDVGDLPAFDAVLELERSGAIELAVRVAVGGAELPDGVLERAQLVLGGPGEVPDLLRALLPGDGRGTAPVQGADGAS